ncbi:MAG TPA: F0F1 ATP synthase subunit A [Patescibacteria group bacterium]|nr:F0F1 ATP synthase subunit A [Patescibacteria group bacterium]
MNGLMATDFNVVLHGEKLFTIGGISITNSMLLGWIVSLLLVGVFILAAKKIKITASGKALSLIEILVEFITNMAADIMHDRKKAAKYAPFLITVFCFIIFNNWAGLLPGVGSITYNGQPLLRAWTSDLTGTLALALTSIILIQIYTVRELHPKGYFQHYFSNKPWNPINLFVGLLEVLGEFTRIASLSLRLFGNIFAGEVLLLVLSTITSYGSPIATLPFIFMELFVGFIQAFVFTTLIIVYLTLATSQHDEEEDHQTVSDPIVNQPAQQALVASGSQK